MEHFSVQNDEEENPQADTLAPLLQVCQSP